MQKLYETYKDRGFEILAVSVDDLPRLVPGYLKEKGLTFTALLDTKKKVAIRYGVWGTPTTFFISRKGMLIGSKVGAKDWGSKGAAEFMEWFLREDVNQH